MVIRQSELLFEIEFLQVVLQEQHGKLTVYRVNEMFIEVHMKFWTCVFVQRGELDLEFVQVIQLLKIVSKLDWGTRVVYDVFLVFHIISLKI